MQVYKSEKYIKKYVKTLDNYVIMYYIIVSK